MTMLQNSLATRRMLLKGAGVAAALAALPGLSAAPRRRFFERIGKPLGVQLYMLGDTPTKDMDGTFAEVARIGFREIELPGLLGHQVGEVRAAADRHGLRATSMHLPVPFRSQPGAITLDSSPQQIADLAGALGLFELVVPLAPFPANFSPRSGETFQTALGRSLAEAGPDHWKRTADLLNARAAALRPFGLMLGYHNHNVEFAPIGGTTGWDVLVGGTDPGLVKFEVDIGWVAAAGRDPLAFLSAHKGRIHWLHVKDIKATTKPNFALSMESTQVGDGSLDWARLLPAAQAAGAQRYFVEQEPPYAIPRIDAARRSFAYLSALRA